MNSHERGYSVFCRIHARSLGEPLDPPWKDYEMRKGFTRKPKADEPAPQVKNYITRSGLERLKDEHRFLLTRERPAVTEVVAWAASNGDRSENADYQYGKRRLRQIDGGFAFSRSESKSSFGQSRPKRRSISSTSRRWAGSCTLRIWSQTAGPHSKTEPKYSVLSTQVLPFSRYA